MPRSYPPEAKQEACQLYMTGLNYGQVAAEMRKRGYASYSPETVSRWSKDGGWEDQRAELQANEGRIALAADANRVAAEMLKSYQSLRTKLQLQLDNNSDFTEGVKLLLQVDAQIRKLLEDMSRDSVARVDKPAIGLEVLQIVTAYLAETDPGALAMITEYLEPIGKLIKERFAEAA